MKVIYTIAVMVSVLVVYRVGSPVDCGEIPHLCARIGNQEPVVVVNQFTVVRFL